MRTAAITATIIEADNATAGVRSAPAISYLTTTRFRPLRFAS